MTCSTRSRPHRVSPSNSRSCAAPTSGPCRSPSPSQTTAHDRRSAGRRLTGRIVLGLCPGWQRYASQDMAFADLIRYHVNVYWEKAPDRRATRTLDWLNDACEAKLKDEDRDHGEVKYTAL